MREVKPKLVGGIGEKVFGKQYRQGNRIYDSDSIAMCLHSQPVGNAGGNSYLYLINESETKGERNLTKTNEVNTEVNGKPFTYVSLFSGIGGFETALNKLGGTCVLASEIDKFANQSYKALYGHPTAGDITKINAEDVPDHDVLVGGFPCQAFSVAGKRGGFDDARGTLFFEVARLAKTKQPRMLLLENVKGLVGHDGGKTLDTIVQTLNDIGYHVDFNVLNSKYFGVPQNRERIFIVAIRDDIAKPSDWIIEGTNVVAKGKRRIAAYDGVKTFNFDFPEQSEVTTRLRDILETEVEDKYYLSEDKTAALVAQLDKGLAIREATKQGYAIAHEGDAVNFQFPDSKTRRGRVGKQIANTLEASNINQGVVEASDRIIEVGKIKEHRNSSLANTVHSTEGISSALDTMQGGGREPKIAEVQVSGLNTLDDGSAYTLNTRTHALYDYYNAIEKKKATLIQHHTPKYRIRKITPLECWRLQGFTDEQHQTILDAGLSDSQRYKQAGNAVTVNVITAIGERLLPYLR